jgi:hypothetical protein
MDWQDAPYRPATVRFAGEVEVNGRTFRGNMRLDVWLHEGWIHIHIADEAAPLYSLPIHAVAGIHWEG